MATFQINNGTFSPGSVLKPPGGVVTVFPNNGATVYFWHQKDDGTWHSSSTLFTSGQGNSGQLPGNRKALLGTIQSTATGTYALTTSNQPPTNGQTGSTGEINIGTGVGEEPDND